MNAWGDRRIGIQFNNGTQFFMGMETSAGERLLKITSRAEDNTGGITFNTGSGATDRVKNNKQPHNH